MSNQLLTVFSQKDLSSYVYDNNYDQSHKNGSVGIKYQIPADPKLDGTETFFIAESMHFVDVQERDEQTRSLSKLVHGPLIPFKASSRTVLSM